MRHYLFVVLALLAYSAGHAQAPKLPLEHLTIREGLPSNDVWCFTKDKQGFLWIGTGRSYCRYDGYAFFTPDNPRVGYCSGIATEASGTVFASVATRGLCMTTPQTLATETVLANNYADADHTNDMHDRVFVDSYNQVWLSDYTSVKRWLRPQKKLKLYALSSDNSHQDASFFEDSKRRLWIVSEIGLYRYDRATDQLTCLLGKEAKNPRNKRPVRLEIASEAADGTIWIGAYDEGLLRFSPDTETFRFISREFANLNVICTRETVDGNGKKLILVGTEKGLSVFYPDQNKVYHLPEFHEKGVHVRAIYDDRANGIIWIGTRRGLFKYRYQNLGVHSVDVPLSVNPSLAEITSFLELPTGHYLLGLSHTGTLDWLPTTNQFRVVPYPANAYTYRLRLIGGQPVAFTDKGVFVRRGAAFERFPLVNRLFTSTEFRDGVIDKKGRFWIANMTQGLRVVDPATGTEHQLWSPGVHESLLKNNYIRALCEGTDGRMWIATCPNGLFYFDEQTARFVNVKELPINKTKTMSGLCVNALQASTNGAMLVASWGGINKISASGEIVTSFDFEHDNMADTYCSNICEDAEGNIWFNTSEGLHIANPRTRTVRYLTTTEGLNTNNPTGFLQNRAGELMLGHLNAIDRVDIDALSQSHDGPGLAVSSVEVKGKSAHQDVSKEIVLRPDENSITLGFSTLNFEPTSKSQYKYKLEGLDTAWVDLGNRHSVSFTNLPPNQYQLAIRSGNAGGIWSETPRVVRFTVLPYMTQTWWFRVALGVLLGGLVVGLMRWRVNTLDERNRFDLQITELKLKALQSQMNPHFLFNSLNSVQHYLLTNQGIEGARYLSKFSKLVRRIMENSNHQYLPFEQIIDTLRMYVEIESFRFNHEFAYEFVIDQTDETLMDALLPPMLLQPYVENAIWHGLMPKEGDKKLTISAYVEAGHIVCVIEDNGVGRRFAPRSEGHISRGQEMTRGIFESLRRKDSDARLDVTDLTDPQGQPAGTRINMIIPL